MEEIISLLDEIIETSSAKQIAKPKPDNVAAFVDTVLGQNVVTSGGQNCDETKNGPTSVFDDLIRKEPSSRIKKNHPSDLIIGNPSDSMITR